MNLTPAPTYDCSVCFGNLLGPEGEVVRPRQKDEPVPCRACAKGSPDYVPAALSVEALAVYESVAPFDGGDPDWVGLAQAVPPRLFEAVRLVAQEIAKVRRKRADREMEKVTRTKPTARV